MKTIQSRPAAALSPGGSCRRQQNGELALWLRAFLDAAGGAAVSATVVTLCVVFWLGVLL